MLNIAEKRNNPGLYLIRLTGGSHHYFDWDLTGYRSTYLMVELGAFEWNLRFKFQYAIMIKLDLPVSPRTLCRGKPEGKFALCIIAFPVLVISCDINTESPAEDVCS